MILTYEIAADGPASLATSKARWQKGQRYTTQDPEVIAYVEANPHSFKVLSKVSEHEPAPERPKPAAKPAPVEEKPAQPEVAGATTDEPAAKPEDVKAPPDEKPKKTKANKPKASKPKASKPKAKAAKPKAKK